MLWRPPFQFGQTQGAFDATVAGGITTWNPSDKNTHVTLTNGNLTATSDGATGDVNAVRSVASHSTGKFFCEITVVAGAAGAEVGVANGSQVLTGGGVFLGDTGDNSIGYYTGGGVNLHGPVTATIQTYTNGSVLGMAIDMDAKLIWWRRDGGNWNNNGANDPATGVGGISLATFVAGAKFIIVGCANATTSFTLNAGGSSYGTAAPSGYGNW